MKSIAAFKQKKVKIIDTKKLKKAKGGFIHFWFIYDWTVNDDLDPDLWA